jgi:hypothetical protein
MESGSLHLLEHSGPHRACYGTPLPFTIIRSVWYGLATFRLCQVKLTKSSCFVWTKSLRITCSLKRSICMGPDLWLWLLWNPVFGTKEKREVVSATCPKAAKQAGHIDLTRAVRFFLLQDLRSSRTPQAWLSCSKRGSSLMQSVSCSHHRNNFVVWCSFCLSCMQGRRSCQI